jgi:hypothetical protein
MYMKLKNGIYLLPLCCILAIIKDYYKFVLKNNQQKKYK